MQMTVGKLAGLRRSGWIYGLAILFNRLVPAKLFRFRYFVVYQLDPGSFSGEQQANDRTNRPSDVFSQTFWCDHSGQFRAVEDVTYFDRSTSSGRQFACGVEVDHQTVGGIWGATESFDESELGLRLQFMPNQAWIFAAVVKKEHRSKGLYTKLLSTMVRELSSRGANQVLVAVNPFNRTSNRIHSRYSFGKVCAVASIRVWNWVLCLPFGTARGNRSFSHDARRSPITVSVL
jgi:GNAT superfamily N-acetyltransferase